ncbi:MAG: sterol desaturase family protein [Chitinophagaceae bacterium]
MKLLYDVFDWMGIPILVAIFLLLYFVQRKYPLRKSVQPFFKRAVINNIISIPSFILLRFMFLPTMGWLTIQNETWKIGLNYLFHLPHWAEAVLAILVFDYTNYLWHVLNHKLPLLWRFHLVHHTDLDLDVTTAIRFHYGELIGSLFFRGTFVLLSGASPFVVIIYEIIFEGATLFHHSNLKLPLRLEKILNTLIVTPRMHGIHHSDIKEETDSNFSVIFSFWDRIHQTIRLHIRQDMIKIGVASYNRENELTIAYLLQLPFKKIRPWKKERLKRNQLMK